MTESIGSSTIKRLPKSTVELTITIPWSRVKESFDQVFKKKASEVEIKGFRKGKAPAKLVEEKLDKTKLYQEVIKELVPKCYQEAVSQHNLRPITTPDIKLSEAKEGSDWKIQATLAEKPEVKLGNYRAQVAKARKGQKKIWLPGEKEDQKAKETKKEDELEAILKVLLDTVQVEIPDLLVTQEVNRLLARLIDETKKLGLTVEQYLKSTGKTVEQLRSGYADQAKQSLKLEFALEAIAEKENITVSDKDIQDSINKVKDQKEREQLRQHSYYLASIIRRQKTLDSLLKPIV